MVMQVANVAVGLEVEGGANGDKGGGVKPGQSLKSGGKAVSALDKVGSRRSSARPRGEKRRGGWRRMRRRR